MDVPSKDNSQTVDLRVTVNDESFYKSGQASLSGHEVVDKQGCVRFELFCFPRMRL